MVLTTQQLKHEHDSQGHRAFNAIRMLHGMPAVHADLQPPCDSCKVWKHKAHRKKKKKKSAKVLEK
jgi:hypothetical protein